MTTKSNSQYDELCSITTELLSQYGARPAAFQAACRQRPDLAGVAIYPTGQPVIPLRANSGTAQAAAPQHDPRPEDSPRSLAWATLAAPRTSRGAAADQAPPEDPRATLAALAAELYPAKPIHHAVVDANPRVTFAALAAELSPAKPSGHVGQ